jgi:hypothetical protein
VWLRLLELLAHLYHYTLDYCLYRLTLAQALSLIDLYNARERKAREASEDAERSDDVGYVNADKYKVDKDTNPEDLPSLSDLRGAFGAMFG